MTVIEKTMLLQYLLNTQIRLEDEFKAALHTMKFRSSDTLDAVEFMVASERLQSFREFSHHVQELLKLAGGVENEE